MKHVLSGSYLRKTAAICLTLTLTGSLLAACSGGGDETSAEKRVLRIGFVYSNQENEQWLRQSFTDGCELLHPELDIQVVGAMNYDDMRFQEQTPDKPAKQPDTYEKLKEMLNGSNPVDVVVLDSSINSTSYLKRLVQDNMLKQLDPIIQENEFDIEDFVPSVINGIKDAGDNNIYALTPTFNTSALYYNKKLFLDAGVEPPTDNMMWDDVFAKAKRVAKGKDKDRIFGLGMNRWGSDPFWDVTNNYIPALQLKMYDDKGEKMSVDSPQWQKVFTTMAALYQEKIIPTGQDMNYDPGIAENGKQAFNPFQGDLFINGRVAMTIADYGYITELQKAKEQNAKNNKIPSVDWDVVTVPQHSEYPGIGGAISMTNLMGINAKAGNAEDAWDFISFNNSKEWAKLKSRSTYEMVSRQSLIKPREGLDFNIKAFYALKPVPPTGADLEKLQRDKPNIWTIQQLGNEAFTAVIDKKKSAADALKEWQTEGDAFLKKLKEDPNATLDPVEGGVMPKVYEG